MFLDNDWFVVALGAFGVLLWIVSHFWDSFVEWWNTEIVADYPYEDDL